MLRRTREGLSTWRRLGPLRGTRAAAGLPLGPHGASAARLDPGPSTAGRPAAIRRGLGGLTTEEAPRGPVLRALPTVAAWEDELGRIDAAERDSLLAGGRSGRRPSLGPPCGPEPGTAGPEIDWARTSSPGGAGRWSTSPCPDRLSGRLGHQGPLGAPLVQHLPVLAAAHRLTDERGSLEEIGSQLTHWIETNPVEYGANLACTSDVAIRPPTRSPRWRSLRLCSRGQAVDGPRLSSSTRAIVRGHLEHARTAATTPVGRGRVTPVAALFLHSAEGAIGRSGLLRASSPRWSTR